MYAAVNYTQIQPGKMNAAIAIFRDSVVPAASQQPGNKGAILLTDPNSDKAIAIALWETEAAAAAVVTDGWYQEQLAKLADVIAGPPVREVYEVSVEQSMSEAGDAKYARTGTGQVQQGKMDEVISLLRESNYPAYANHQGFKGAMLLTQAGTNKSISITLWETEADTRASDARIQEHRQAARDAQDSPPVVEYYEVSVRA